MQELPLVTRLAWVNLASSIKCVGASRSFSFNPFSLNNPYQIIATMTAAAPTEADKDLSMHLQAWKESAQEKPLRLLVCGWQIYTGQSLFEIGGRESR